MEMSTIEYQRSSLDLEGNYPGLMASSRWYLDDSDIEKTCLGGRISQTRFIIIVAVASGIAVAALAIGLGVGLSSSKLRHVTSGGERKHSKLVLEI